MSTCEQGKLIFSEGQPSCRQIALDAYEGEQKLNHTASNREHLWRLLQGGELIAPVPPLPPREIATLPNVSPVPATTVQETISEPAAVLAVADVPEVPEPKVKKTRSRKKVEAPSPEQESESVTQASPGGAKASDPPKRRRKKTAETVVENAETGGKASSSANAETPLEPTDADTVVLPTKPKRYPVGEQERE